MKKAIQKKKKRERGEDDEDEDFFSIINRTSNADSFISLNRFHQENSQ